MNDRIVEESFEEIPEFDELLERVLICALDEAKAKVSSGEVLVPFTGLLIKEDLFIETHPGNSVEDCFAEARKTVAQASGALAYTFCYDGYIDTDEGMIDAIIAEGGMPGQSDGVAVGYVYHTEGDELSFDTDPVFIGPCPNYMEKLTAPSKNQAEAAADTDN